MTRRSIRNVAVATLILFSASRTVFADPMVPSGGAVVNLPPPAVDWWARIGSIIAVVVSVLAFLWTRLDKRRERKDAKEAKEPAVDAVLEDTISADTWMILRLTIKNRGDFTIALDQIAVSDGFVMSTGRGDPPKATETYDATRASPGANISLSVSVYRRDANKASISTTVEMTEFRPKAKTLTRVVKRDL